jgi:hexosaminidase
VDIPIINEYWQLFMSDVIRVGTWMRSPKSLPVPIQKISIRLSPPIRGDLWKSTAADNNVLMTAEVR